MLSNTVKKQIREHSWKKHSNPSQFLQRVSAQGKGWIKELTFLAEHLDEDVMKDIFNKGRLEPLIHALLLPERKRSKKEVVKIDEDRIFFLSWMFSRWGLWTIEKGLKDKLNRAYFSEHENKIRFIVDELSMQRTKK